MLIHPEIDPIALQIGPLAIRWYGLTYLVAFVMFLWLGRIRARQNILRGWKPGDLDDLLLYGILGVVLGGRLGYCLFYKPLHYLANPLEIIGLGQAGFTGLSGMSFHGGLLGVIFAMWMYSRRTERNFIGTMDFIAPLVPLGLASGRIGNFINAELPGRAADPNLPWAMIFPTVDKIPRHPSQLYQFALEGVLLFVILWIYALKPRALGRVSGAFLLGYGVFRFIAEFFREPDAFLGFLSLGMTMGQWLCVPMVMLGSWLLLRKVR
ncbi:MAG: prolipoprotein diacylglyceryl transferase [Betaproteobacteria bacterium]|nr:MAG: prolipoprotein diacylglyceryl transferase [Betaproteobacteria bacterium]